jgi:hypothetical protein
MHRFIPEKEYLSTDERTYAVLTSPRKNTDEREPPKWRSKLMQDYEIVSEIPPWPSEIYMNCLTRESMYFERNTSHHNIQFVDFPGLVRGLGSVGSRNMET